MSLRIRILTRWLFIEAW